MQLVVLRTVLTVVLGKCCGCMRVNRPILTRSVKRGIMGALAEKCRASIKGGEAVIVA